MLTKGPNSRVVGTLGLKVTVLHVGVEMGGIARLEWTRARIHLRMKDAEAADSGHNSEFCRPFGEAQSAAKSVRRDHTCYQDLRYHVRFPTFRTAAQVVHTIHREIRVAKNS